MATATSNREIAFAGASGSSIGDDITWLGLWLTASGSTGFLSGIQVSNNPDALALGEVYYIAAGGLVITQTAGSSETEAMAIRALRGRLDGTLYLAEHEGDPGTTGANEGDLAPRYDIGHRLHLRVIIPCREHNAPAFWL